ncbi:TonB-dependent receptor [Gelidibacter maritimus]|uniref:TonB-dependent receptor n=1 Tax=Gelidibacter maritimus TaxID=2761487 RepID=A0A7W2R4X8_9FLAO|nr:TonB-dependent receptor [Gelidibacter maritimus]MBA6154317.1 TonB-dependent receptor [Gelidibacter maritimus]
MKQNYILIFLALLSYSIFGQNVSGKVNDENNEPLAGVTVIIKGSSEGTITDFNGNYVIKAAIGEILIFSYVGYNTVEKTVEGTTLNLMMEPGVSLREITLIGSRNPSRTALNSLSPVDVIDVTELTTSNPQVNLNQILNFVAPSFNANTQTIADGTDHIDPASLRGLGPDQVLVLINGKRRHTSSLVNVNGSFGKGSVGTDLNAIPTASIKRIEVLRDGASAQYGSDAIAGVINIVLENATDELKINVTTGANFSKNANEQTGGVDGATTNINANYGIKLGDNGGYINFTGDFDYRDSYNRMKEWEGNIFNRYNTIERVASNDGYDIAKLLDDDVSDVINYGNQAGFNLDPNATKADLQAILSGDNTEAELASRNLSRSDFNMRVGQSEVRGGRFFTNMALPIDDQGSEVYAFGGLSSRKGSSGGFFRLPRESRTYTPMYINGFLPEINSKISDQSLAVGIKGKIGEWDVDFSNTYGKNRFEYIIGNTSNTSMQNASPTSFDAGGFSFAQNTVNLDINNFYDDIFAGLNVAFGGEYRIENYEIFAGQESSYSRYTPKGDLIVSVDQNPAQDFFGSERPGGAQVFPGFNPNNELNRDRNSIAGYIDLEADITDSFLLSFASRFEDYSDFGSTINFKLASLVKVNENLNLRLTGNTGFRAPSLHQMYFNSTSTVFDAFGVAQEVGTFTNDSRAAQLLGIPQLKEEKSRSVSLGVTVKIPDANMNITLDGYFVGIDDRVVYTGQFKGPGTDSELDRLLYQANATAAAFFANAIDTESKGLDLVITHNTNIGTNMVLKNDLAATFSKTKKVGPIKASRVLEDAGLVDTYFQENSRVYLEEAVPRTKINLSNTLSAGNFHFFLRNVYFGEVTEATSNVNLQQVFSSKVVTDLSVGYHVSDSFLLTVGANNLLDIYPDLAKESITWTDANGATQSGNNRSTGRFDWSRSAQQFGVAGRFLFARLSFTLK